MSPRKAPRLKEFDYLGLFAYFLTICARGRLRSFDDRKFAEDTIAQLFRSLGVARYILLNPVRAGLVLKPEDYPLCGSGQYTIPQILVAAGDWKPTW